MSKSDTTARDVIASAIEIICSDGNSDRFRVAADIESALYRSGFVIVAPQPHHRTILDDLSYREEKVELPEEPINWKLSGRLRRGE